MTHRGKADMLIEPKNCPLSIVDQCRIIGIARATYYYKQASEPAGTEDLRQAILRIYEKSPFYGVRRIHAALLKEWFGVGERLVRKLLRQMCLRAVEPKRNLSKPVSEHKKYPYLLRGLDIVRPNQVWATDITYIKTENGFVYLVAIIDWFSRRILAWRLSNTLDSNFCIEALKEAAAVYGAPEIVNTDQGSQFTSVEFLKAVPELKAKISMDGKGRALDNVIIERFWKSIKYEDILIREYPTVKELRLGVAAYILFYNTERLHQSHHYRTPEQVYSEGILTLIA